MATCRFFMGLMALPNIIALFLLSDVAKKVLNDYDSCKSKGKIHWDFKFE
ncbi:MAG: alanine:cation symporter family protein [Treponemataceae bacterium]